MKPNRVVYEDWGRIDYEKAWNLQEQRLQENLLVKAGHRSLAQASLTQAGVATAQVGPQEVTAETVDYFIFCEHSPVFTLGKSGKLSNLLASPEVLEQRGISFVPTNRGGDITFHGPGQVVGYPILDLERYGTDLGKYLRHLEEVIILTLAQYGIRGERSAGETGVWIEPDNPTKARKICAMGIRCSRWITMHGFALNVNTDLSYFDLIIPCGIQNKQVTSLERELGIKLSTDDVKQIISEKFEQVFGAELLRLG